MMATDIYIVNELLAYVFHRYNSDTYDAIQSAILDFYCEEDITEAKTVFHAHYENVIGQRIGRQNRGNKSLKEKEVTDILEAMKKLDESGPQRPVKFVAINLTNIPSTQQPASLSVSSRNSAPDDMGNRLTALEVQVAELVAAKMSMADVARQSYKMNCAPVQPDHQLQVQSQRPAIVPYQPGNINVGPKQVPQGKPLPFVQHGSNQQEIRVPQQPASRIGGESSKQLDDGSWRVKQRRNTKYGKRKDDNITLKANPRRHEFVVSNTPKGCAPETVKEYITDNGVTVIDIRRLSNEEWDTQSFHVSVSYGDKVKVENLDFWPEDIGYRLFFKKRRTTEIKHGSTN